MSPREKIGAHGIPLTVDAEYERESTIEIDGHEKDERGNPIPVGLPVRWVALPYVVLRDMMFEAQRAAEPKEKGGPIPDGKPAFSRFQDATLLKSIKSVDGVPFTAELLMGLRSDIAKELADLTASAGVVDQGKSGASSAKAPGPTPETQEPSST